MGTTSHRPRFLRLLLAPSTLRKLFALIIIGSIIEAQFVYYQIARAERAFASQISLQTPTPRVYIAGLHWNNEGILRASWNSALVALVEELGPDNVFVSIYESGSWDDTKGALRDLDRRLNKAGVARQITLDETTHADLMGAPPPTDGGGQTQGWVQTREGERRLRRIPYLAGLRNLSLQPLLDMAENGTTFDHVLFLGDVVFTVADVIALLNTNNGRYAAACSLDFSKPPSYYDTFALRDSNGHEHASQMWPYFRSSKSRKAMLNGEAVPVASCWNGIVSMPASAFTGARGLQFRGVDDSLAESHLEGSECCLIHADNPASRTRGVYLNPIVRVGYNLAAYQAVHSHGSWLSAYQIWTGLLKNRLARWFTTPGLKEARVSRRVGRWEQEQKGREEPGRFCLINEMQVLVANGWAHL
ncbi:cryptococcal mannosyltransferase 1-domain-containing protein [Bombardia bombarda]|uniref:Cryptococcal mannosyltransferase 1-domain-containing protein n=1 Tax=Bombardia bombarda TaxID=252184 RepID=A0AA40CFV5_9PEZI|nr:cryptococcal mannosyltransferase 1-domain-containing protein [Bombardia bombarda]